MRSHTALHACFYAAAAGLLLAACDSPAPEIQDNVVTGGTLVISTAADPGVLLPPFVINVQGKTVTDLLYDRLAEIGPELNTFGDLGFEPRLAERWTWSPDSLSIAFHLDERARWHDGQPVRAEDVRFTYDLVMDPATGASNSAQLTGIDSVTATDSLTAVVWFSQRYPEQFFDAVFHTPILPAHLLRDLPRETLMSSELARNPVGNGPYRIARYEQGQVMELVADTGYYRGRAKLDRVLLSIAADPITATTRLFAGEADLFEAMRAENMQELAKHADLKAVSTPGSTYSFLLFNMRDPRQLGRPHPLFGDRELRRALTMAVNREAIVRNVFDTLAYVGLGPFTRMHGTADTTLEQIPYDTAAARQLLDSLGWVDSNGDGVRERGGRRLAFSILVPATSPWRQRTGVLMQEQLARVGVAVDVERLEINTIIGRSRTRDFDAFLNSWVTDPSPSGARETWGTASAERTGGLNFGHYSNPVFDAAVDSGLAANDIDERNRYFRRAYETIIEDAPGIWLFEPKTVIGMHRRFDTPPLRAHSWWVDIPSWSVPEDERIARDRMTVARSATP